VFRDVAVQAWHDYLAWSNPTHFNQDIVFGKAKLRGGKLTFAGQLAFSTMCQED
jgi:hypothetical protein